MSATHETWGEPMGVTRAEFLAMTEGSAFIAEWEVRHGMLQRALMVALPDGRRIGVALFPQVMLCRFLNPANAEQEQTTDIFLSHESLYVLFALTSAVLGQAGWEALQARVEVLLMDTGSPHTTE